MSTSPLLQRLLQNLGMSGRHDALVQELGRLGLSRQQLYAAKDDTPYLLTAEEHGVEITMQCPNPEAPLEQRLLGFHGIMLHTGVAENAEPWRHDWPFNINPRTVRADDFKQWGNADEDTVMVMPLMACLTLLPSADGQILSLVAVFKPESLELLHLTIFRVNDWLQQDKPVSTPALGQVANTVPVVTCKSHDIVPQSGIYEGRLPDNHAMAYFFNHTDSRFIFQEKGGRMISMGLGNEVDEALVTWTLRSTSYDDIKALKAESAANSAKAAVISCRAGERIPKTGVYEALLSANHPNVRHFNQQPGRFFYAKQGAEIPSLSGLAKAEQDQVVATWVKESFTPAWDTSVITCKSNTPVPRTGVYEGRLPLDHPDYQRYIQVPGRFCFRNQGEEMIRLGMISADDEALVVWGWIRAER